MAAKSLRRTLASRFSSKSSSINDLSDDTLLEILCRLPCIYLFRCKCVSKKWSALISDPNFHCQYLSHQHSHFQKLKDQVQQSFILNPCNALVIVPKVPAMELGSIEKGLTLSFLGSDFEYKESDPPLRSVLDCVFGCSNELLLCAKSTYPLGKFYICNPLTKEVLNLTPAPPTCYGVQILLGFICHPYYHIEEENVSLVSKRGFKVVRILLFGEENFAFKAEVFSSGARQWTELFVSCPRGFSCETFSTPGVAYNGKLCFLGVSRILVYDPYNKSKVATSIGIPIDLVEREGGCLGVSCGKLRISQFSSPAPAPANIHSHQGKIWELEHYDCETGEATWRFLCRFYLPETIFKHVKPIWSFSRILAFHPHDGATVFLRFCDCIISYNLRTKEFKADKYQGVRLKLHPIIPVILPWWPTPIP